MSLNIQTNVSSLTALQSQATTTAALNKTINQLSTGYRINSAADDPAGLGIAVTLDFQALSHLASGSTSGSTSLAAANAAYSGVASSGIHLSAAIDQIRDVDIAPVTSQLSQQQVLQQAGASVLASASQQPQLAIKMLPGQ